MKGANSDRELRSGIERRTQNAERRLEKGERSVKKSLKMVRHVMAPRGLPFYAACLFISKLIKSTQPVSGHTVLTLTLSDSVIIIIIAECM